MFKRIAGRLSRLPKGGLAIGVLLVAAAYVVFFWRLGSLTSGLSPAEAAARFSSRSLSAVYNNPVNAPHKLLQFGLQKLDHGSLATLRLPSVIFGLIFAFSFYKLAVSWYGRAIGAFGALIFISLPLLVVSSRQASTEIMFFAPVLFMFLYNRLIKMESRRTWSWLTLLLLAAVLIYTPGMAVWLIAAFIICRPKIILAIASVPAWVSAVGLAVIGLATVPIVLASIKHLEVAKTLFLVPAHPAGVIQMLENTGWMVLSLFAKTGHHEALIIGRLPLLSILLSALLVFGAYAMNGAARTKAVVLGLSAVFAVFIAGVNNSIALLAFSLPALGLLITAGLRYLYIEWRTIFPRNPVPKNFALVLIAVVASVQIYYGLRYSLAAWPNTASTKAVYVLK
jgi:hypothetical protein